jgi:hypothetical protein
MHSAQNWPPQHSQTPAEYAQTLADYWQVHGYAGWELVRVVRGVPILRVRPLAPIPEMHRGTQILKSVRIQVLSRRVKPGAVRDEYERVLIEQGAHWHENNHGLISYQATDGYLEISAGTGGEVSPLTLCHRHRPPYHRPWQRAQPPQRRGRGLQLKAVLHRNRTCRRGER